jgi:hypothetical protein
MLAESSGVSSGQSAESCFASHEIEISGILGFVALCIFAKAADAPKTPNDNAAWIGAYSSPSEIAGYSGTVLVIEKGSLDGLRHRMTVYSDVVSSNAIEQPELEGGALTDGDKLYIATASGFYHDGRPVISGRLERYTRVKINGRTVLLRDDALKAYREHNRLYDYGVLIKVAESIERFAKLADIKHESIKILYSDSKNEWKDPFVRGPNKP